MYGWTKEYILENLNYKQLNLYYEYGYRYDMERRGFKFKEPLAEGMSREELRELYYTPEELAKQKEAVAKMYGDVESEVNGGDSR
jgi:hypothetical protein